MIDAIALVYHGALRYERAVLSACTSKTLAFSLSQVSALSSMFLNSRLSILCRAMVAKPRGEGEDGPGEEEFGDAEEWDAGGDDMNDDDDFVIQDNRFVAGIGASLDM